MPQRMEKEKEVNEVDDTEFEELEDIRRFGYPGNRDSDEGDYFTLPPKRKPMINDWREWRTQINDVMSELIDKKSTNRVTLTAGARMKTPDFFKGSMSIHGQRVKDEYGGKPVNEDDDQSVRVEKKIMDENFFLFGIPRISLQREGNNANNKTQPNAGPNRRRRHSMVNTPQTYRVGLMEHIQDYSPSTDRRHSLANTPDTLRTLDLTHDHPLNRRRYSQVVGIPEDPKPQETPPRLLQHRRTSIQLF